MSQIKITFPDGSARDFESGVTAHEIAKSISPGLAKAALAVKLDSKGPILYRQTRVGLKEKLFQVIKFRTMYADAEQETGATWALKDDGRITRVCRFLRKSRLDELPQLFNVLKGDMSFIGPRPERPEFVDQLSLVIESFSERDVMRPGITGWAQIHLDYGRSIEAMKEKLAHDLYYVRNVSLQLDTITAFYTFVRILGIRPPGPGLERAAETDQDDGQIDSHR